MRFRQPVTTVLTAVLCQCAGPSTRFDCSWFSIAGWLNRQQRDAIDYLREENRLLREQLGGGCAT
jgi:hypothetical protein